MESADCLIHLQVQKGSGVSQDREKDHFFFRDTRCFRQDASSQPTTHVARLLLQTRNQERNRLGSMKGCSRFLFCLCRRSCGVSLVYDRQTGHQTVVTLRLQDRHQHSQQQQQKKNKRRTLSPTGSCITFRLLSAARVSEEIQGVRDTGMLKYSRTLSGWCARTAGRRTMNSCIPISRLPPPVSEQSVHDHMQAC